MLAAKNGADRRVGSGSGGATGVWLEKHSPSCRCRAKLGICGQRLGSLLLTGGGNADDETFGRLCDQSAVRQLQLDDVTLTYIADGAMALVPTRFFESISASYWYQHSSELNAEGLVPMSAGGLLVERDGRHLLIDTGLRQLVDDDGTMRSNSGDLLKVLGEVGVSIHHERLDRTDVVISAPQSKFFPRAAFSPAAASNAAGMQTALT